MKKITALLIYLFYTSVIVAQIPLLSSYVDQLSNGDLEVKIIKWDALTGNIITKQSTPFYTFLAGSSFYDANVGRYCFRANQDTFSNFVSYDVNNKTLIPLQGADYISTATEVDMSNGNVYAIAPDANNNQFYLSEYSFAKGQLNPIVALNDVSVLFMDANCYNSNQGVFYLIANDLMGIKSIFAIDVRNKNVVTKKAISGIDLPLATNLEYDNVNNKLYALYKNYNPVSSQTSMQIAELNATTGNTTLIRDLPQYTYFGQSSQTFDQKTGNLIFIALDSAYNNHLNIYNVASDSLLIGVLPKDILPYNIEADNYVFALKKYQSKNENSTLENDPFKVYPNPANNFIQLKSKDRITSFSIFDETGKMVKRVDNNTNNVVNVANLQPGLYTIRTTTKNNKRETTSFIKL